ncbi:hypothetical protein D9M69_460810 [compost metagenome]
MTDIAGDAVAVRQTQAPFLEAYALVQQAPALQPGQPLGVQTPRQLLGQGIEAGDGAVAIQHPGIHQALQLDILMHRAPHDARLQQHQQAEHEHLAVGIEPTGEGRQAAFPVDQPTPARRHAHGLQHCAVAGVIGLAGQQGGGQGIGHGAYAHLQGAAVAHQGAGVQADGVVLQADRHVRGGEQAAVLHLLQHQVEGVHLYLRRPRHIGQLGMQLGHQQDGLPCVTPLAQAGQQVEGDVRIAAQAEPAAALGAPGHQLGHQVDALALQVGSHVAVVEADVVLLGLGVVQLAGRLQVELLHPDVGRQLAAAQVAQVVQLQVVGEHPPQEGAAEALVEFAAGLGLGQGQAGVDRQLPLRQRLDALVEGIDEAVGLAEPERDTEANRSVDALQHLVDGLFQRTANHGASLRGGPDEGWTGAAAIRSTGSGFDYPFKRLLGLRFP